MVEDVNNKTRQLFAYLCMHHLSTRIDLAHNFKSMKISGILPYVEHETLRFPGDKNKYIVIIYEKPLGGKVAKTMSDVIEPMKEADYINKVARPVLETIADLFSRGITHRAIRPTNMFYMDRDKTRVVLGDFMTMPPGYEQPVLCETIESAMCIKEGHGVGTPSDDLYAFGVTSLFLILGKNTLAGKSDVEIMNIKMKKGSYAGLVQDAKIYVSMVEVLRGLLADNMEQRWTINSIDAWMNGRRLNPLQSRAVRRSQRAFVFNNAEYYTAKELAFAFSRNWSSATSFVDSDRLDIFLRRGLEDNDTANEILRMHADTQFRYQDKSVRENMWLTHVCMIMDKSAPIRYKGINFFAEGLGSVVAAAYIGDLDFKTVREILELDLVNKSPNPVSDSILAGKFKNISMYALKPRLGSGFERILYELNPNLPCISPFILSEYADDLSLIIKSLEKIAKNADHKKWPVDKHIAAYVSCHFTLKSIDQIESLNSTNNAISTAGMLSLLSLLQWTFGPHVTHNLCAWVGGLLDPIIESYHNREKRASLEREIPNIIKRGNIPELYGIVDNDKERDKDLSLFSKSKKEYQFTSFEIQKLEHHVSERKEEYIKFGNQVASIVSFSITIITLIVLLMAKIF